MTWTAAVTVGGGWLRITSGSRGTNAGTITVAYTANTGAAARTGWVTVTAPGSLSNPLRVSVVQAGRSPGPGNRSPTVRLRHAPARPTRADTIVFTSTASDPDRDALTYRWYVNGVQQTQIGTTASVISWRSPPVGTHTVRVVVSDGRGGTAEARVSVTVRTGGGARSHTYVDVWFGNTPNPITDVHTTTFQVLGPMAGLVTEIVVMVFDLSGKLVWQGSAAGAELVWHTDDLAGRYLANGVYLYQITARVAGTSVASGILKLAIYR